MSHQIFPYAHNQYWHLAYQSFPHLARYYTRHKTPAFLAFRQLHQSQHSNATVPHNCRHSVNPDQTANIVNTLAELNQDGFWRPFGSNFVELSDNSNEPA